tara:strand:+ start:216 stop:503 length:288 start_codon:yes stop_codon:yes gene_type:complete
MNKQELLDEFVKQVDNKTLVTDKKSMADWWKRWLQFNLTAKLTMIASVAMSWRCAEWFMNLPDPTTQQSAFVSVIMGVMTGVYGIYLGRESRGGK